MFKSVGCAAWDLAACRVARALLSDESGAPN
jgi:1-piperideine-2-carboxylate/1-pyrroline-2-carboxylate reductase [NAD(P)H]